MAKNKCLYVFPRRNFLFHGCLNTHSDGDPWIWRLTVYEVRRQSSVLWTIELLQFYKPIDYVLEIPFDADQMTQWLKALAAHAW